MTRLEERVLIYTAVAVICSFAGVFAGLSAGALSFILIVVVIEALFWFGPSGPSGYRHREHRILFNGH